MFASTQERHDNALYSGVCWDSGTPKMGPLVAAPRLAKLAQNTKSPNELIGVYQFHCHPNFHGVPGQYPLKFPYKSRICDWNIGKGNRGTLAMQIEKLSEFMQEEKLMDENNGLYDKEEDKVTLAIDVFVEEQKMDKFDSDPNKSTGKIVLEIGKLSEFTREIFESERNSETIQIKGLPYKIMADIKMKKEGTEKCLGFYLKCTATVKDDNWSCNCSVNFRIVSQKKDTEDFSKEFEGCLKSSSRLLGFENFITFAELMDPIKGFYDENGDKVTLAIDVIVKENEGTETS
ncbi:hypothetical protein niasHT_031090 [Heterodera trifolii]|uniref:MATH domain-containing protein n=1 Tax=Heterodera trifolii TaxID=157864 RepID=A0ABD2IX32_9BILA